MVLYRSTFVVLSAHSFEQHGSDFPLLSHREGQDKDLATKSSYFHHCFKLIQILPWYDKLLQCSAKLGKVENEIKRL